MFNTIILNTSQMVAPQSQKRKRTDDVAPSATAASTSNTTYKVCVIMLYTHAVLYGVLSNVSSTVSNVVLAS
jgi:hypothetical protein